MNLVIFHEGAVGPEDDSEGQDREDDGKWDKELTMCEKPSEGLLDNN